MKNGWRVILGIVVVAVVVGALCCGVGVLTGADTARILQNLNDHFHLDAYITAYTDYAKQILKFLGNLF